MARKKELTQIQREHLREDITQDEVEHVELENLLDRYAADVHEELRHLDDAELEERYIEMFGSLPEELQADYGV